VDTQGRQRIRRRAVDEPGGDPTETGGNDERLWEEACRREETISDLLRRRPNGLTRGAVDDAAWELGPGRASLYRLICPFRRGGSVTALMPRSADRPRGLRLLGPKGEVVIGAAMDVDDLCRRRLPDVIADQ
jgi:hypothetical protein